MTDRVPYIILILVNVSKQWKELETCVLHAAQLHGDSHGTQNTSNFVSYIVMRSFFVLGQPESIEPVGTLGCLRIVCELPDWDQARQQKTCESSVLQACLDYSQACLLVACLQEMFSKLCISTKLFLSNHWRDLASCSWDMPYSRVLNWYCQLRENSGNEDLLSEWLS